MIGVGNVSNQFELGFHAPGAIYNGATVAELEAMIVHARGTSVHRVLPTP